MLGAWGGHVVAAAHIDARADARTSARRLRVRQIPLAVLMVFLTTLTLWSLGQGLFVPPSSTAGASLAAGSPVAASPIEGGPVAVVSAARPPR
jgi:NhaP-type Na+/H+ or K+/H+ antiporter